MELKIWGPESGLPSVDYVCLQSMAYAKFCGAPVKFIECNNPWASPTGRLPLFQHGPKVKLTQFDELLIHLKKQNFDSDVTLSKKQNADIQAYAALLKDKLSPALLYIWWCDERNYITFTRPWYAKHLPFPLNYFIPGKLQKCANEEIHAIFDYEEATETQMENVVYKAAQESLTLLSQRLGDQDFFFGKFPCSLDAIVFGYLAPILKVELPNGQLCNYLKACGNLVQFVARILQRYFPIQSTPLKESSNTKCTTENDIEVNHGFPHKWRDIILWGALSCSAMIAFALTTGIISITIYDDDAKDYDNDQEDDERNETVKR